MTRSELFWCVMLVAGFTFVKTSTAQNSTDVAPCLSDDDFYRNPLTPADIVWTPEECTKYYLCLENEVFEFNCSHGLLFDVERQICDYKTNVTNCDLTTIETGEGVDEVEEKQADDEREENIEDDEESYCDEGKLPCDNGKCIIVDYFCDGHTDCPDDSDESWCDPRNDTVNSVPECDTTACRLPDCWCSLDGTEIPGNMSTPTIPQMITVTFEDAINSRNFDRLVKIFNDDRRNPNNCPIRGTFFISHEFTNYHDVQQLWNDGHEIAIHSLTHREPEDWWTTNATIEDWFDEMIGEANVIHRFAGVHMKDITGLRAPFLRVGWNRQFLMMTEFGFVYDSSIIAPVTNLPIWPYTLDYRIPHTCLDERQLCPTKSYPGQWEIPINPLIVEDQTCPTLDMCSMNLTKEEIYGVLMNNFKMHYSSNRAPLGLHFRTSWIEKSDNFLALSDFIEDVLHFPDVYFVTNQQVIEWIRSPKNLSKVHSFQPWHCYDKKLDAHEVVCDLPNSCRVPSKIFKAHRYLYTCFDCPKQYPWLRNEFGNDTV